MNQQPNRWLFAGLLLLTPIAQATTQGLSPDPSVMRQDHLRRLDQTAPPMLAPVPAEPQAPQAVAPESVASLTLKEIQFSPSALLSTDELRSLGQRYLGRSLQTKDIQAFLDEVSALYRAKGVLTAMPVLPQQDLQTGVLRVLLVEGRLGRVTVRTPGVANAEWVKNWFDLPPGLVVTNESLNTRLGLFNSASDSFATAAFVPGESFGVSDLAIDVVEGANTQFWTFAETTSARTDASDLVALGWRMAPVTTTGGRLEGALLRTAQGRTVIGGGSWPLGTGGWRTGIHGSVSDTRTRVVSDTEAPDLWIDGKSSAATLEIGKTWAMSSPWTLGSSLRWGTARSSMYVADEKLLDRRLDKLAITGSANYDTRQTRATLKASATRSSGDSTRFSYLDLSAVLQADLDTQGQWQAKAAGFARMGTSGQGGQADPFVLGGADSVRGFNTGAITADKGNAIQLELHLRPYIAGAQPGDVYVFADLGQGFSGGSWQKIASTGLGFQVRISQNLTIDLVASHQLQAAQAPANRWMLRLGGSW
jgi:hemolysin activation/secretion protein